MKKIKIILLTSIFTCLGLASCTSGSTSKVDSKWLYDENEHYHRSLEDGKWVLVDRTSHDMKENEDKYISSTCITLGTKFEYCTVCGYEASSYVSMESHTYVTDETAGTPATCSSTGVKVSKCTYCNDEKEDILPFSDHVYNEPQVKDTSSTNTGYSKSVCKWCDKTEIRFNALDYVAAGSTSTNVFANKDNTTTGKNGKAETLKMSKNGNFVEYVLDMDEAISGTVYLYGWVDRFSENSTKTFFSGNNASSTGADKNGNFALTTNGVKTTITNSKSYADMGMTASGIYVTDANSVSTSSDQNAFERANAVLCEVGSISLNAGTNTIRYSRVDSYNLNLIDFVLVGTTQD